MKIPYMIIVFSLILYGIYMFDYSINDIRIDRCKNKNHGDAVMVYGKAYTCTGNEK